MNLSVIIPTITGREESLARAIASYRDTTDERYCEIIVVQDFPTWPSACNEGFRRSKREGHPLLGR